MKPASHYFFFHFHKCAGTSVVSAFQEAGYPLNPRKNGNVLLPKSSQLPSFRSYPRWERYSLEEQRAELQRASLEGYKLLAAERTFPEPEAVRSALPEAHLFTILRDPWKRFLSNYRFSMGENVAKGRPLLSLSEFQNSGHFGSPNFFVRTLLGRAAPKRTFAPEDIARARAWAGKMDSVVVLEDASLSDWFEEQGIRPPKERLKIAPQVERAVFDMDESEFREVNREDYDFYSYVRNNFAWRRNADRTG